MALCTILTEAGDELWAEDGIALVVEDCVEPVVDTVVVSTGGGGGTWINGRRVYHGPRAQIHLERPITAAERKAEANLAKIEAKRDETEEKSKRLAEEIAYRQSLLEEELTRQELKDLEIQEAAERARAEQELAGLMAEKARLEQVQARIQGSLAKSLEAVQMRDEDEAFALILVALAAE